MLRLTPVKPEDIADIESIITPPSKDFISEVGYFEQSLDYLVQRYPVQRQTKPMKGIEITVYLD